MSPSNVMVGYAMSNKRTAEIFSEGCQLCLDVIEKGKELACGSCDVQVLDLNQDNVLS